MTRFFLAVLLMLSVSASVAAGPLEDGIAAEQKGDLETAKRLLRPLAEQGNADAQLRYGSILWAVPEQSIVWFRRAAEQGNAEAQRRLAVDYEKGWGVSKDYAEAAKWFRRAAEQGNGSASASLAHLYSGGDGVPQDGAEAIKWLRRAVDQGYYYSLKEIGMMYDWPHYGVPQDGAEAMKWYLRAVDHGDNEAKHLIGDLYVHGNGVPQDYVMAHMWFNLAAASGDQDAIRYRDDVAKRMTPAQIAEAQKLAREWKPSK